MNKPRIRFQGYTDAWEQRKLGDVFKEYSDKHHEDLEPLTIIQGQGTILRSESDRNLQYDKAGLVNYKLVNKDDFILHLRSFEGGLEVANSKGIVSPAYHIFHGEETDSRFYYPFFRSHYFINVLLKPHVYGIRDGKSIDVEGMKEILIPYPQYDEQKAMGDYFESLDHLITLHQCKPNSKAKNRVLAWEQRKLGEVSEEFQSGKSIKADKISNEDTYPVYGGNGLRGYTDSYNHDGEFALIGRQGALCGNMNWSSGKAYFTEHAVVVKANKNNNTKFIYYILDVMNLGQYSDQSAQPGLAVNKLIKLENMFPQKEEQECISRLFSNLDTLITLHQRQQKYVKNSRNTLFYIINDVKETKLCRN